jgi:hypothetical protein
LKKILFSFFIFLTASLFAQSFDLDQIEQIWRPRLKADSKFTADASFADTSGLFNCFENSATFTFPIKSKVGADIKLDLSSLKLRDILKNSVKVKAYQVLGSVRAGTKQLHLGFDSIQNRQLYFASASVLGVKLTKKYRVLFYSLNTGINEEDKTFNTVTPRFTGILGQFHIKGLHRNYYYGLIASYSDGVFLPVPFFGGSTPIASRFYLNFTLPASLCVQYKPQHKTSLSVGIAADGFRSGIEYHAKRMNLNYGTINSFVSWRQRLGKIFSVRMEGGYCLRQRINITQNDSKKAVYPIQPGLYVQMSISVLMGQSLFEKLTDNISGALIK